MTQTAQTLKTTTRTTVERVTQHAQIGILWQQTDFAQCDMCWFDNTA